MAAAKEIRGEQPQTDPAFSTDFNETARFTDLAIAVPRAKGDGLFFLPGGQGSAGVAPGGGVWYTDGKSTGSPPCRGGELLSVTVLRLLSTREVSTMAKDMKILKRSEMDPNFCWNTADLYPDDQAWTAAFEAAKALPEEIAAYRGRLGGVR